MIGHGGDNFGGGVFVFSNLGLENPKKNSFALYPNPSHNNINFITYTNENYKVSITDCLGKIIYSEEFFSKEIAIDISNFTSGMYFATITSHSQKGTLKFVKY